MARNVPTDARDSKDRRRDSPPHRASGYDRDRDRASRQHPRDRDRNQDRSPPPRPTRRSRSPPRREEDQSRRRKYNDGPQRDRDGERDRGMRRRDEGRDRERDREARRPPQGQGRDRDRDRNASPPPRSGPRRSRSRSPAQRPRSPPPRPHPRPHSRSPPPRASSRPPRSPSPAKSTTSKDAQDRALADKLKPNFRPSGLLAAATNTVRLADGTSTVLKYNEPPEARRPAGEWRLFVFKGEESIDPYVVSRQSAYLFGRDRAVSDIPLDHPSCSKQHAVLQFRQMPVKDEYGATKLMVKPCIIDLESTNGTHVNKEQIPAARFYEVMSGDLITFGLSNREYVLMADTS